MVIFIERSEIDFIRALAHARLLARPVGLAAHVMEARDIELRVLTKK